MKVETLHKNLVYISNYRTNTDDNFEHKIASFKDAKDDIFSWFAPANNYPETVLNQINRGTTLESILFEDLIYKTGDGFVSKDVSFLKYLEETQFKSVFKNSNSHYWTLGNIFLEIITDEKGTLVSQKTIQPQKCRLTKDEKFVYIYSDWAEFDKKKATKLPLYPKFKKFTKEGIITLKSIYHIKLEALGFDHYGINTKMIEALLLNDKEHGRNNWQNNQIKNGFKRDFFMITDFALSEKEKLKTDAAFAKVSGDEHAGGVETIEAEGGKLVPAQANYNFDFTKDDTSDQLFLKMGFPKSLVGIKSGGSFSVEQVESDYDQYLPKVESQQEELLTHFKKIYTAHTKFEVSDLMVINNPPSVILQNYMQYMNDDQKNKVIEKLFTRYGIE